jgi:hypothetical protein
MRAFLSSVISGYGELRDAADKALADLDHDVIRAEQFTASPNSPRVACLDGVRQADFVVLLLGERYGDIQPGSGLSPTHEEFREAQRSKHVFVLVQKGVSPDASQLTFIREAQDWAAGQYTASFGSPDELRSVLTKAVSRWQLSKAAGPVDAGEASGRAIAQIPAADRHGYRSAPTVVLSVVGAPSQQILRPSEYEKEPFGRALIQDLSYGETAIFDYTAATKPEVVEHGLRASQDHRYFEISEDLSLLFGLPLKKSEGSFFTAIVEEEVQASIEAALRFAHSVFQKHDSSERLSAVALAAAIRNADSAGWVTRRQFEKQERQRSATMRMNSDDDIEPVVLRPPICSRGQFRTQPDKLAEDLMVTLRRRFRS